MAQRRPPSALRSGFWIAGALLCAVAGPAATSDVRNATIAGDPSPVPPANLQPGDQMLIGDLPTSTVKFTWSQPAVPNPVEPRPAPAASQFLCFYVTGTAHDCNRRTGIVARVEATGSTFVAHVVNPLRGIERFTRRRIPGVDYEFTAALPADVLAKDLEWTVVACGAGARGTCSQSPPRRLALTARDLAVADISADTSGTDGVRPKIKVRNDGRATGGSFTLETRAWEVLPDGNNPRSLKDIGDRNVQDSDIVITRLGELIPVADYLNRGLAPGDIIGFHRPGFGQAAWTRRNLNEPVPVAAGTPLRPGTCTAGEDCTAQTTEFIACDDTVTSCVIRATTQTRPVAFVVFARVTSQPPYDFEPADNVLAKGNMGLR